MPNSEQPRDRRQSEDADSALKRSTSNGRQPKPTSDLETPSPIPNREEFQAWLQTQQQIQGLEAGEANVRWMNAVADAAEAMADEAWSRAEAEPKRQKMSLWERGVRYGLLTLLVLAAIGLEIALFTVSPWLISLNLPIIAVAAVKRFGGRKEDERSSQEEEKGGDP